MKKIEVLSKSGNYSAVNIGSLSELEGYSLVHPKLNSKIEGKVFLKEATQSTGTEISFQTLPPKTDMPYFHIHKQNEETYIVLKGEGFFQVDEDCFPIAEGSVIRIAPQAKRSLCNSSDTPMVYMVIQSKENSLEQWSSEDGQRVPMEPKWKI